MPEQLIFNVKRHAHAQLNAFICHPDNTALLQQLVEMFSTPESSLDTTTFCWFLHGRRVGKTYLLNAVCHAAQMQHLRSLYLPMRELIDQPPQNVLEGLEQFDVVCIDDVDCLESRDDWQRELFHLYNRMKASGGRLFVSGNDVPEALGMSLDDLVSRFKWGLVYRVHPLQEDGLRALLKERLLHAGMRVDDDVLDYIMLRTQRHLNDVLVVIDTLDQASLEQQRVLTKPFIKQLFGW